MDPKQAQPPLIYEPEYGPPMNWAPEIVNKPGLGVAIVDWNHYPRNQEMVNDDKIDGVFYAHGGKKQAFVITGRPNYKGMNIRFVNTPIYHETFFLYYLKDNNIPLLTLTLRKSGKWIPKGFHRLYADEWFEIHC
jgi:hypothetical protein